ncbi:Lipoprotein-releasing system ATP-binding protein LolD [hydrothermal vent metagenome]|uniref:Lipoprotein-releasing system ATP-binding protein LolD n=1 Tax=hydrothermal vent metagenome TaxID=652676 RepID=A0A3B0RYF1_9ZZZZ
MSNHGEQPILRIQSLQQSFVSGSEELQVLRGVNLNIHAGEVVGLLGPSGSGKSTLLHAAGLLEQPKSGKVWIGERECLGLPDRKRTRIRRNKIGFVYQFHHLLPEFSALDNVAMPMLINGVSQKKARIEAARLLDVMGLSSRLSHQPSELSGGEQQRVAIARAIANKPAVLLADEPTGNLDPNTSATVFQSLFDLVRIEGVAALVATHNVSLTSYMDKVLTMSNGLAVETVQA